MPYFQDPTGGLHFLSDQDIAAGGESYLPAGCVQITDEAAAEIQNPTLTLVGAQAAQIVLITAAYNTAISTNVPFTTAAGVVNTYQADSDSRDILLQTYTGYNAIGAVPTGFYWIAIDNTEVEFTIADLKGLYAVMLAQGQIAFSKKTTLKRSIQAATTVAAVQDIVWA